jgi:hypothetical protein
MSSNRFLSFIRDEDLTRHVKKVLDTAHEAFEHSEDKLYSNVIDPFSAVFDALGQGISLDEWMKQEKSRQMQKTLQNALGDFHQDIIGSIPGWENFPRGKVIDVINKEKRIIAEIKNKYNTTKGSDKKTIYDNLASKIKSDYKGFTGYYVEIIPKTLEPYDEEFTPPDNVRGRRRRANPKIRVIDGKSFYALASGKDAALRELYYTLPRVTAQILGNNSGKIVNDHLFEEIYSQAYA